MRFLSYALFLPCVLLSSRYDTDMIPILSRYDTDIIPYLRNGAAIAFFLLFAGVWTNDSTKTGFSGFFDFVVYKYDDRHEV